MKENKMGVMEMKRLILTMSFPIMISMLVQALYNIVDSMFVARVSEAALNAVSICYPVQMIMVAVACGTGVGINALLSRSLGEQKPETAEQVAMHGLFLAACSWIVFALIGLFCAEAFLSLFASDAEIMAMGVSYMQICTICSIGVFAEIAYERIMQSTGNPIYNMIIQGVGALINIILDPILIFGMFGLPQMGVSGAALATVIGQIAAMFLGAYITRRKVKEIQVRLRKFRIDPRLIARMYRIAVPAILMQSVMSFMTVMMNMILVSFSALAVSVFSIYYKLQQFVFMAVLGMTNAIVPIISYNFGAGNKERITQAIRFSLWFAAGIMLIGTLLFQLFPDRLLMLFEAGEQMFAIGIPALKTISLSFLFAGISMVLCAVFQSLNRSLFSLVVTLLRQMIILLPLAYVLASSFGLDMCWWAFLITEVISALISLFFLGNVHRKIIHPM